jgi:hypothetical protein
MLPSLKSIVLNTWQSQITCYLLWSPLLGTRDNLKSHAIFFKVHYLEHVTVSNLMLSSLKSIVLNTWQTAETKFMFLPCFICSLISYFPCFSFLFFSFLCFLFLSFFLCCFNIGGLWQIEDPRGSTSGRQEQTFASHGGCEVVRECEGPSSWWLADWPKHINWLFDGYSGEQPHCLSCICSAEKKTL